MGVPKSLSRQAAASQPFDWSGLTHGRYDVPTEAVYALRQHDERNSGKYPGLAEDIAERGIEQPLEVSLHDGGRVVLRGGSHRVNNAHDRGHPTVPVQVVDMRNDFFRHASSWTPDTGIFAPTTGLDHRLFNEQFQLRGEVREAIMEHLDQCLRVDTGLAGSDWQEWLTVYIAGGSASEWAGGRPDSDAQDLDVLVGLDLPTAQGYNSFEGMDAEQAATALNAAFRRCFNEQHWAAPFGGIWDLTAYCNPRIGTDIARIKPYAAWNLTDSSWAVKPPHLPEHTLADFDPAVLAHARAVLAEARAILRMPEPLRTREARALWDHIHEHRCQAFSQEGQGWQDVGNVDEKWLQYAPGNVLGRVRELALAKTAGKTPGSVVMMHPRDLMQYVETYRTDDEGGRRSRRDLAESFRQHGYDPELHGGMSGDKHFSPISSPIELVHDDNASYFMEGNHRVHALNDIGYDQPVPVLVKDMRTPKTAAVRSGDFLATKPSELPWGNEEWAAARREPWHAAAQLAQEQTRHDHPNLLRPFPRGEEGDRMVAHFLHHAGYGGSTEGAYVARHPDPRQNVSTPSWIRGKPGVALHPDKWDYGTVAHECAHHAVIYDHAAAPGEMTGDEETHGPEWAGHYAQALNKLQKNAGDDFLAHHQRYYDMIQEGLQYKRPKDLDEADRQRGLTVREGAGRPRRGMMPISDVLALPSADSPHESVAEVLPDKWTDVWFRKDLRDSIRKGPGHVPPVHIAPAEQMAHDYRHGTTAYQLNDIAEDTPHQLMLGNGHHRVKMMQEEGWTHVPWTSDMDESDRIPNHREAVSGYQDLTDRSGMIYLDIPDGLVQGDPDGVDDHHITLVYLGKDVSDEAFDKACTRARQAAAAHQPMDGILNGLDTFEPSGSSEGKTPAFVPAYIPGIGQLYRALEDLSASEHRHYKPHVTLGYYGEDEDLPAPHPPVKVSFTHLHVKRGDDVASFPLGSAPEHDLSVHAGRGAAPTEESAARRRERVDRYLERQPGERMDILDKWGPTFSNPEIHGIIHEHDGPTRDEHWEHLPDEYVSLRQPIHTHQGHVYPEMVRQKLREDDPDYDSQGEYHEYTPGGDEPKFVRHEGKHYLLDGNHRYVKARLMGETSMSGKIFDTANPEHKQSNCYECHAEEAADDYDHDSDECETCQRHGWNVW